jgi:hypothetical protein
MSGNSCQYLSCDQLLPRARLSQLVKQRVNRQHIFAYYEVLDAYIALAVLFESQFQCSKHMLRLEDQLQQHRAFLHR